MADVETIKQAIAHTMVEAVKAKIVAVNGEKGRQVRDTVHHNTAETSRSWTGSMHIGPGLPGQGTMLFNSHKRPAAKDQQVTQDA